MKTVNKTAKGISPVIATVIIVAVAIAISIAVAGWLFGLWGGFAGGTPQIQVSNVIVKSNGSVEMYIVNTGTGSDNILRVELNTGTQAITLTPNETTISANFRGWITASPGTAQNLTPGQSVTVTIYFEKTGTQTIPSTVRAS